MNRRVRYLSISDVHLGHPRTTTPFIIKNLVEFFYEFRSDSPFTKLDAIFIVGDLFDQLLDMGNPDVFEIMLFLDKLIKFCDQHKIKLRFLEGTPSHDRRQNRIAEVVSAIKETKADVKWIDTLHVEYIKDLDINVLYVPDEFTSSADVTLGLVKDLLQEKGLQQVDIAMMHGMFAYQMEGIPGRHDTHDVHEYLRLTKHFINIGHIHTHSSYERAIAQGSFDRLAQNEDEAKGACLMTIRDDGVDHYEFIINKGAKIYKTIEIKDDKGLEDALAQIDRQMKRIPDESYVRIKAPRLHGIFMTFPELKAKYPFIHFSKLTVEEEEKQHQHAAASVSEYSVIEIRPENVVDLLLKELPSLSSSQQSRLHGLLTDLQTSL